MRPHLTFLPDSTRPASGRLVLYTPTGDDLAPCQDLAATLGIADLEPSELDLAVPSGGQVVVTRRPVYLIEVGAALQPLLDASTSRHVPASVRTWALATRLALTAVASHRLMPHLVVAPSDDTPAIDAPDRAALTEYELYELEQNADAPAPIFGQWQVDSEGDPAFTGALDRLAEAAPAAAVATALSDERTWHPRRLLGAYLDAVADTLVRQTAPPPSGRPRERLLPWTTRWQEALGDPENPRVPLREEGPDLAAAIEGWQARSDGDGSLVLTLDSPDDPSGTWTLTFGICDEDGEVHEAVDVWSDTELGFTEALLAGLSRAARVFPPLDAALGGDTPTEIQLDLDQAWQFIAEATPLLTGSGVSVTLPSTLAEDGIAAQIRLETTEDGTVDATWEVSLDDRVLSDEEIGSFLDADDPLGFYGGRWVKVDEETRAALLARGRRESIGQAEALALALAGTTSDDWFGEGTAAGRVVVDSHLGDLLDALRDAGDLEDVAETPEGFIGELRPYQQRGVAWLRGMADLGMGAVLADAMGLGKTIQLIGLLVSRPGPFLVVCPTSVVGNWQREINKFAPDLEVTRYHGADRPTDLDDLSGVVVTSYGTLRRDIDLLDTIDWDIVTLDEAQQVKNPTTAAAQAVRRLRARAVFALTGTPLENRLAELWAVIDATNRGLLGTRGMFAKRFVTPVEVRHDAAAASRLRRLVSPFVMRRSKDDPEVAKDLPEKIERTVVCGMTAEQAALYEKVTEESLTRLVDADGIGRRGRILALLTALKQVTNHPAQYLKQAGPIEERSGKLGALREIIEAVTDAGDQALVFTQFTRMGELLKEQLTKDLGAPVPFLHGGLSVMQRDALVEDFQSGDASPVLIISTRAGGTGLNLTAATHVVHYDRWWNPAVEDQATDRAHRIGQTRTVEVHKLVTAGTLEERIAEMLERKRALADAVVGAGETWITELDDASLAELVRLSADVSLTDPGERVPVEVLMSWGDMWRAVLGGPEYELQRRVRQGTATYRSGRVSDVRLGIGRVSARVQGSRATPFLVEIEIPVLTDEEWDVVLDLLAAKVRYSARLLAGQHPEGLAEEAAERGVRLIPTREEISVAAGHSGEDPFPVAGAAVWEAVASRIDSSPFPLLQLRGRGRERVLRDIGRRRKAGGDGTAEGVPVSDIAVLGWSTEAAALDAISIPPLRRPRVDAPGMRVLGEPDGWAGALSPADLLSPLVVGAADRATDLLIGPPPPEDEGETD